MKQKCLFPWILAGAAVAVTLWQLWEVLVFNRQMEVMFSAFDHEMDDYDRFLEACLTEEASEHGNA